MFQHSLTYSYLPNHIIIHPNFLYSFNFTSNISIYLLNDLPRGSILQNNITIKIIFLEKGEKSAKCLRWSKQLLYEIMLFLLYNLFLLKVISNIAPTERNEFIHVKFNIFIKLARMTRIPLFGFDKTQVR